MLNWHHCLRMLPTVALISSSVALPVSAQVAPQSPAKQAAASPLPAEPVWVLTLEALPQRTAPDEDSDSLATLRQFSYLEVLGYDGDWARVLNPRTRDVGFVPSLD